MNLIFICFLIVTNLIVSLDDSLAARLKDIASIRGVRENQLIGYGVVVGLKGTGDGKAEFTAKSLGRMLDKLGVRLENQMIQSKNAAAVIVTAQLPPFAKAGNNLDVTVSALGEATSLEGGILLQTPLRAANDEIYAVAQGAISLGGGGKDVFPTVGRIPNGAIIERDISVDFATRKMFRLTLHNPDFMTAARVALAINKELGGQYASARDAGTIDIVTPFSFEGKGVELIATIESITIHPDQKAKVVINERTGTVVIGENVKLSRVAISHGNLTLKIGGEKEKGDKNSDLGRVFYMEQGASVKDLVDALNRLGVSPKDLIAILQSIKAAGALHGELDLL
ncbi:MAG: flagellar basal body P-ring protein FlgI [Bdellovibrionaceae bacterium]|nr:flagellar basal body P-ring protein FlgI [Pseudobdellovibrionaceae bacterium]MDW8190652.1 flagellar basal body P-ring protein FlgI [Pseudobdellovibrionaceae bacterium]